MTNRSKIHFTKMEGAGNDYIYINAFEESVPTEERPALVRKLSDRHFGIGGDGVIFICPSDVADFEMEMYNADGTRAEMCGNGIRCVGKYVYDHAMTGGKQVFTIVSAGQVKTLTMIVNDDNEAVAARVDMGSPVLEPGQIPVLRIPLLTDNTSEDPAALIDEPIEVAGKTWHMTCVSMGNPHAVVFIDDVASLQIETIGPLFESHPRFPRRVNTEFVQVIDRTHVKMRVWERGTGETLACGTGCCATGVACVLNGKTENHLEVEVLGGRIEIEWDQEKNTVYMTGPATTVFEGTVQI